MLPCIESLSALQKSSQNASAPSLSLSRLIASSSRSHAFNLRSAAMYSALSSGTIFATFLR